VLETSSPSATEECLAGLLTIPALTVLELRPKEFVLTREHMHLVGMMDRCELRLHSRLFSHQPLNRMGYTHIDDSGVKALVDSICSRSVRHSGESGRDGGRGKEGGGEEAGRVPRQPACKGLLWGNPYCGWGGGVV